MTSQRSWPTVAAPQPGHVAFWGHEPQRPGPGRRDPRRCSPSLVGRDGRRRWCACSRAARHRARLRQPRAGALFAQTRSRSRQHERRHHRGSDREQLGRHALRRGARLLPDRSLAHIRVAVRHGDRHGGGRSRGGVRCARARPRSRIARAARRAARRHRARRARAAKVPDQEHDRVSPRRIPGRRHAARDLPPADRRLRGHARVRRRGSIRDGSAAAAHDRFVAAFPEHRGGRGAGAGSGRRGRERGRADGRAGSDHGRPHPARDARALEGASSYLGGAAGGVRRRRARGARALRGTRNRAARPRRAPAAARFHEGPARDRDGLERPRGDVRSRRPAAAGGHLTDNRGRVRSAGADRRVRDRHSGAAPGARLPYGSRRPRVRRQPALHAHAQPSASRQTASATKAS